jgi:hypothetical protein
MEYCKGGHRSIRILVKQHYADVRSQRYKDECSEV